MNARGPSPADPAPRRAPLAADRRGVGIMILAWALWALDPIVVCRIGPAVPRALLAGLASLIAGLMFFPYLAVVVKRRRAVSRRHFGLLVVQAALFTALCQVCYVAALRFMNPGVVSAVLRTQMAAAVILAVCFLGERLDRRALAGIVLIGLANLGLRHGEFQGPAERVHARRTDRREADTRRGADPAL